MGRLLDLTGEQYGRLVVQSFKGFDKHKRGLWLCECVCGNERILSSNVLRRGNTTSCGCYRLEKDIKHGMSRTQEYKVYRAMLDRCYRTKNAQYKDYGGRGIRVYRLWVKGGEGKTGFQHFMEYMGERPYGYTLERKNNDLGYRPGNCYWATRKTQGHNRRTTHPVQYKGRTTNLQAVSRQTGVGVDMLRKRVFRFGWSVEKAVSTPTGKRLLQK